jgi:hypothetical protein
LNAELQGFKLSYYDSKAMFDDNRKKLAKSEKLVDAIRKENAEFARLLEDANSQVSN